MSGIFSILSDGQAGLFRLQQARRAAAGGATGPAATGNTVTDTAGGNAGASGASGASAKNGGVSATKDGTRHLSELLAKGSSDSLTDFMRGAATALNAMKQAQQVSQPKARAEEKLQDAERRIKELRNEMRMAAARGDRAKVMQLAKEAAALAKQAGNAAKEYGRGIAASADMAAGGGVSIQTTTASTTTSTMTAEVSQTTATVSVTAGAETDGTAAATAASTAAGAVTAEAPAPVPVEAPPAPPSETGAETAQTSAQPARQEEDKGGGELAAAINAAVAAVGGGGSAAEGKEGASATGQGAAPANPFQAQMDANAQRTARFREADTFARRVEMVLAAVKNVLGEAKASNAYDTDHTRRKNNREELKQYDKVVEEADKAVLELRASAFGTPGGGASATATAGVTADAGGAVNAAVPVPAGSSVNVVT